MTAVFELTSQVGVAAACQALAVPRGSFYRSRLSSSPKADSSLTVEPSPKLAPWPKVEPSLTAPPPGGASAFAALAKRR